MTRALTVAATLTALLAPATANACGPNDYTCQAVWECHVPGTFATWAPYNPCTKASADVCIAVNAGLPLAIYVQCTFSGATQAQPTSLEDFLASLEADGPGQGAAPEVPLTVRTVDHEEVLRVLGEDAPKAPAPAAGVEVTR